MKKNVSIIPQRSSSSETILSKSSTSQLRLSTNLPKSNLSLSFSSKNLSFSNTNNCKSLNSLKKFSIRIPKEKFVLNPDRFASNSHLDSSINCAEIIEKSFKCFENPDHLFEEQEKIEEIVQQFCLKTIEKMKKDYMSSNIHEKIYRNLLAFLSELDFSFYQNQMLQFSMSRSREMFPVYFSRTGHVFKTLKSLPKLVVSVKISKFLLTHCKNELKSLANTRLSEHLRNIFEILSNIVSLQEKVFKTEKIFEWKKTTPKGFKKKQKKNNSRIIQVKTLPTECDNRSISPLITFDTEESCEIFTFRPCTEEKSAKTKLLEKLFTKVNFKADFENCTGPKEKGAKNNENHDFFEDVSEKSDSCISADKKVDTYIQERFENSENLYAASNVLNKNTFAGNFNLEFDTKNRNQEKNESEKNNFAVLVEAKNSANKKVETLESKRPLPNDLKMNDFEFSSRNCVENNKKIVKSFEGNKENTQTKKTAEKIDHSINKRLEWEETRKVLTMQSKKQAEEQKKNELIAEIKRKKIENQELQVYISEKKKREQREMLRFREEEIKESRRIKELRNTEKKKEFLDEVKRNLEKSQLAKGANKVFDS